MSFLATSFYCEGHHSSLEDCNQNQEDVQHCGDENVIGVVCGEMVFAGNPHVNRGYSATSCVIRLGIFANECLFFRACKGGGGEGTDE